MDEGGRGESMKSARERANASGKEKDRERRKSGERAKYESLTPRPGGERKTRTEDRERARGTLNGTPRGGAGGGGDGSGRRSEKARTPR